MIKRIIGVTIKSILLLIGFAIGLGMTFAVLFVVGIPMIILFVFLLARMIKHERRAKQEEQDVKAIGSIQPASVQQPKRQSSPAVDAAAAYVIGKAVTNRTQNSPLARNPNTERYRMAQEKADHAARHKQAVSKQRKEKVKLTSGKDAWLHTMPNGNQQLVDLSGRMLARYDQSYNRTTDGTKVLGKGNLIPTLLK